MLVFSICADGTFKEVGTESFRVQLSFKLRDGCEEGVLLNEDSCFNVPSISPSEQIYLQLREPGLRIYPSSPFLLAWHLRLCSAVIVDLYFDSMDLRILLICVFLFVCTCMQLIVCFSLPVCVCALLTEAIDLL